MKRTTGFLLLAMFTFPMCLRGHVGTDVHCCSPEKLSQSHGGLLEKQQTP